MFRWFHLSTLHHHPCHIVYPGGNCFLNFKVIIFAIWVLGALTALPMGIAHSYDQVAAIVVIIVTCCHINMNLINPIWPPVTFLRISVQIRIRARWKNLTFLSYEFGKGLYTFYPVKLSRFAEKKLNSSEKAKFHKGGPLRTGTNASLTNKSFKSQTFFGGFWASKPYESFWIW